LFESRLGIHLFIRVLSGLSQPLDPIPTSKPVSHLMPTPPTSIVAHRPTVGVIVRFKNSANTLPDVLAALRQQTVQPDLILGVNNGSIDGSPDLLRAAGGRVIEWTAAYHHPQVLNFAMGHCTTDLVLVLSSHTVFESETALEELVESFNDPRTACASGKWDKDPFFSDAIDWQELQAKGLKFGSIYSNSMGMLRKSLWERIPFDESIPTMEDGAWAVAQVHAGYVCRRLNFPFRYQRGGRRRDFIFALITFQLAARHGLPVAWLGVPGTLRELFQIARWHLFGANGQTIPDHRPLIERLKAWLLWRFVRPDKE